jgi:hypothetical protein
MTLFVIWYAGTYPDLSIDPGTPVVAEFQRLAVSLQEGLSRAEQLALCGSALRLVDARKRQTL